ncbi:hypothetical protein Taro_026606 [Colocasia esculenta]|uniref:RING-type domain-containing protein n=1 Tax=Colocasia esculenta TaxID=4460 RepID=A0A843VL46_COLES|nr:hypothetical protein [Colocasia esculenta]
MYASRRSLQQVTEHPASAPPPEPITVDSDIVVILAALLCALICVVGLALVARCAWLRRTSTAPPAPPNKGLKKKVLRSLPKLSFQPDSADHARYADCPICLTDFTEGDEIRVLPQCGHGFHVVCVDMWLASHSSCPSCRQILVSGAPAGAAPTRCEKCGASSRAPAPAAPPISAPAEASRPAPAPSLPEDLEAGTVSGGVTGSKSKEDSNAPTFLP